MEDPDTNTRVHEATHAYDSDTCPEDEQEQSVESEENEIFHECKNNEEIGAQKTGRSEESTEGITEFTETEVAETFESTIVLEEQNKEEVNTCMLSEDNLVNHAKIDTEHENTSRSDNEEIGAQKTGRSEESTKRITEFTETEVTKTFKSTIVLEEQNKEEVNTCMLSEENLVNHAEIDTEHKNTSRQDLMRSDTTGSPENVRYCDICKESNLCIPSTSFCSECEESYCLDCTNIHRSQKATRTHAIGPPKPNEIVFMCETCCCLGTMSPAKASCKECKELYCVQCCDVHKKQKATRAHLISSHAGLPEKRTCEPCEYLGQNDKAALHLCIDCDEVMCYDCFCVHTKQKATKDHTIVASLTYSDNCCQRCCETGIQNIPDMYCRACSIKLCGECAGKHRKDAATRDHKVIDIPHIKVKEIDQKRLVSLTSKELNIDKRLATEKCDRQKNFEEDLKPGVPGIVGQVQVDSVCLAWEPPTILLSGCSYQLRFKEAQIDSKWIFYPSFIPKTSITLTNLKSDTMYVFQVRMVGDEKDGPYSDLSETVETVQSAATRLMDFMCDVDRCDANIALKRLPLQENRKARDLKSKTRKLVVGEDKKTNTKERTIMLVGATGTGKSTLVDGMINFIFGVNWNDHYRLTVVDLEEDELSRDQNQAVSQTQWITCYTIHPLKGSRLDYTLNIIDTPGFGDTRGIERDREIVEQMRSLFSKEGEAGVVFIDAVCFLIKAPDARLTPTQMYIFNAIMSLFGQDIENNFCMLVTFADGKRPPVLSALKEAKLPHEQHFPFNNSGLFAENCGENVSSFSSMFWEMGCKSFSLFFQKLTTMETKSLKQTRDVLQQRELIELNIENLQPKLDAGLNKVEELRIEIRILEDFKTQIEDNSDFKYTVSETEQRQIDLPKGQHVTNCLTCHITCHKNCMIPNDEDKRGCTAMNEEGYCTQCSAGCFWNMHRNTPYIFDYITVTKHKTYTEKLEKYRKAKDENMTRQKVVERMQDELHTLEWEILELMERINHCNNILRQIALRPDPLSVVEHIDLLIESEKQEKRAGFQARISSLKQCRRRATIGEDVERFTTSFTDTKKIVTGQVVFTSNTKKDKKKKKAGIFQTVFSYFQEQ